MAPKKAAKAKIRGARQAPLLAMLVDSPDRSGPSRTFTKSKLLGSTGIQVQSFGAALGSKSTNSGEMTQSESLMYGKGKSKEENSVPDHLWCDGFAPRQKSELGIHKKKIEQVEGWLREALDSKSSIKKYRRILALSGPSGSGKSSLVRMLSESENLNYEITEWRNDDVQRGVDSDYYWDRGSSSGQGSDFYRDNENSSLSNKLGLFLSNASRYSALAMQTDEDQPEPRIVAPPTVSQSSSPRRVILLEDLPNLSHLPTRTSFNATLEAFLQQTDDRNIPFILIISESIPRLDEWGGEGSYRDFKDRNEATLTVRNLIPNAIRSNAGFMNIEFNPVAPTILSKALKRVLEVARPLQPQAIPAPSSSTAKDMIEAVIESADGDLRSAVNTLQLICLKSGTNGEARGIKRKANGKGVESVSRRAVAAVSGKESSLVLFHALGKILYNRRAGDPHDEEDSEEEGVIDDAGIESSEILPLHWQSLARRKSRVDPEMLWRSMPVDASTLQAFLHQNYTPFCDNIEQCASLCDNISLADATRPSHEEWYHTPLTDYYNFLITVHGSLLSLPSPVSRNQHRKLRGVTLFQRLRQLRENTERLSDVRMSLKGGEAEEEVSSSVLSNATATSLVCEVLPILSKSHPSTISNSVRQLVHIPWTSNRGEVDQIDDDGEEIDVSLNESKGSLEGTIQIESSISLNKIDKGQMSGFVTAEAVSELFDEEDDDIEDF